MPTAMTEWLLEIDSRWSEIDLLLEEANRIQESNISLYNALCRAAIIFVSAHFEGSIKSLVKYLIEDLNSFRGIERIPNDILIYYINSFILTDKEDKNSKEAQLLREKLLPILITAQQKIDYTVYLKDQKNPTPDIISRIAQKFGITDIFKELENSDLEEKLFSETPTDRIKKLTDIRSDLDKACENFPYLDSIQSLGRSTPTKRAKRTIYEDFIDNTLKVRHDVAHGTILDNPRTPQDFEQIRDKVRGLQYSILILLTERLKDI